MKGREGYARDRRRCPGHKIGNAAREEVTRPTIDRVKEAMFSALQFSLPGARVLDLFAGSGQLGIEAISRGAAGCVFLDRDRRAVEIITRNCKAAGVFDRCRVAQGEAESFLGRHQGHLPHRAAGPALSPSTLAAILPAVAR